MRWPPAAGLRLLLSSRGGRGLELMVPAEEGGCAAPRPEGLPSQWRADGGGMEHGPR